MTVIVDLMGLILELMALFRSFRDASGLINSTEQGAAPCLPVRKAPCLLLYIAMLVND